MVAWTKENQLFASKNMQTINMAYQRWAQRNGWLLALGHARPIPLPWNNHNNHVSHKSSYASPVQSPDCYLQMHDMHSHSRVTTAYLLHLLSTLPAALMLDGALWWLPVLYWSLEPLEALCHMPPVSPLLQPLRSLELRARLTFFHLIPLQNIQHTGRKDEFKRFNILIVSEQGRL